MTCFTKQRLTPKKRKARFFNTACAVSALANARLAVATLCDEAEHKAAPTSWVSDHARRSWFDPVWITDFKVSAGSCFTIIEGGLGV